MTHIGDHLDEYVYKNTKKNYTVIIARLMTCFVLMVLLGEKSAFFAGSHFK
jgi:hypothetical protein